MKTATRLARSLAPEDIEPGRYVAVLTAIREHFSGLYSDELQWKEPRRVLLRWLPDDDEHVMRVVSVCLPFVLVRTPEKKTRLIDTRQYELAEIPAAAGRAAFRAEEGEQKDRADNGTKCKKCKRKKK